MSLQTELATGKKR